MPVHYEDRELRLHKTVCGSFGNNAYLLVCKATGESLIIDTPGDPGAFIDEAGATNVRGILITHNHWDHLAGFAEIHDAFGVPVGIGTPDAPALDEYGVSPSLDVSDGAVVRAGRLEVAAIFTPGHTPGSTCYTVATGDGAHHLFSGDTLFPGGPGRSSSPEALQQMILGITGKLHTLPEATAVYPGHGDDTSIGESKREYEPFASRAHPADLAGDVTWLDS